MHVRKPISRALILVLVLGLVLPMASSVQAWPMHAQVEMASNTYTISGRVTDGEGTPLAGINVEAVPDIGPLIVLDEEDNPVSGAQVFRNDTLAGTTGLDGRLTIDDLTVGDRLVARLRVHEEPSPKGHHNQDSTQNWAYRVYVTSMEILGTGVAQPWQVDDPSQTQTLRLRRDNTLIGFNIVASVEWDANEAYLSELQQGMDSASAHLYNATNGHMLFDRVTIYDNNQHMGDADYQIRASNQEWPRARVGGLLEGSNLYVFLGRHFSRSSDGAGSAMSGSWTQRGAYSVLVHEFGHYGLYLYDSYLTQDREPNASCTSPAIRANNMLETNATLMCWEFFASQFAMQGVPGLWSSECENTYQWHRHGQSDWETIAEHYRDPNLPARWTLKTPADYGAVVPGPTSIPVSAWSLATIGHDANTGVCNPPPSYQILRLWGSPARGAEVYLRTSTGRTIEQGETDDRGMITVLGAASGDRVIVNLWGLDVRVNSFDVQCAPALTAQDASPTTVLLEPVPFEVTTSVLPGSAPHQAQVWVSASTLLPEAPVARLTQHGADAAVAVPLTHDQTAQAYTGLVTLTPHLPQSGSLLIRAEDAQQQEVEIATSFSLETVVQDEDWLIRSADGQAELYILANTLLTGGAISIEPSHRALALPEDLQLLSGPYTLQAGADMALMDKATLSLRYLDFGNLRGADAASAEIHRWDDGTWIAMETTVGVVDQIASAGVDSFGTYALLAEPWHTVYLPSVVSNSGGTPASQAVEELHGAETTIGSDEVMPSSRGMVGYRATTDANGQYTITGLPPGTYIVSSDSDSMAFTPATRGVTVPPNALNQDFTVAGGVILSVTAGSSDVIDAGDCSTIGIDDLPGPDGQTSLREAICVANNTAAVDTVALPAGVYLLTISGPGEHNNATGDLDITDDLTINGAGAATTMIDGGGIDRVMHMVGGAAVVINDLTISGGRSPDGVQADHGGGIYNEGILTLNNVTVRDNATGQGLGEYGSRGGYGGGIYNHGGKLALTNSTISGNETGGAWANGGLGGGIYSDGGTVALANSTVSGNTAGSGEIGGDGGGIANRLGIVHLRNSTISGNRAGSGFSGGRGGGIYNSSGTVELTSTTVSANSAGSTHSPFSYEEGGGIYNGGGTVNLNNTILGGNSAGRGPDCSGTLDSLDYNLIEDTSDCNVEGKIAHSITDHDPQLSALALNPPGDTATHALQPDSPAVDTGSCKDAAGYPIAYDQRGVVRPQPPGGSCDIGAYERE